MVSSYVYVTEEKADPMPTVIAYHDVKDLDLWLASPVRDEAFATIGITGIRTFVDPTNPRASGCCSTSPTWMPCWLPCRAPSSLTPRPRTASSPRRS